MELYMNQVVRIALSYFIKYDYDESKFTDFNASVYILKKYPYSLITDYNTNKKWLRIQEKKLKPYIFGHLRFTFYLLRSIYRNGKVVTTRFNYKSFDKFENIDIIFQKTINDFLQEYQIENKKKAGKIVVVRNDCAYMINLLQQKGINKPQDITYESLKGLYDDLNFNGCFDRSSNLRHNFSLSLYLKYICKIYDMPFTLPLMLDKNYLKNLFLIIDLNEKERREFIPYVKKEKGYSEFEELKNKFLAVYYNTNYIIEVKNQAKKFINSFDLFMHVNDLSYSIDLLDKWLEYVLPNLTKGLQYGFKRNSMLFSQLYFTQTIDFKKMNSPKILKFYHWFEKDYNEFKSERIREGKAPHTIQLDREFINRFFLFIDSIGIDSWEKITPQLIVDYQIQDKHSSIESKNAYLDKLRLFLRFLARKKLVPDTLELAVHPEVAKTVKIVDVLNAKQKEIIYEYIRNSKTRVELRLAAMMAIGLHLGFRKIDIVNLKFSNINWDKEIISIIQQKTGEPLIIPFPEIVGNSLFRYITEGRPVEAKNSKYVFISNKAPYVNIRRPAIAKAINRIFEVSNCQQIKGFHIFRRTFATLLLNNSVKAPFIADALGQISVESLKSYLSLDEINMHKCSLSLDGIEFQGEQ